jgi:hypothetical protein
MFDRRMFLALAALALSLSACRKASIASYRVPKEHDHSAHAAAAPADAMASTPVATAQGPGLAWIAPAHWQAKPPGTMRKGSYAIAGDGGAAADLSITAFGGETGGEFANVNRWRGQLSLPPFAEGELAGAITRSAANGLAISVVDFNGTGENPQRILAAIVPHAGSTWFFKLMGPEALVAKEKPAFLEFLKTVKPATP